MPTKNTKAPKARRKLKMRMQGALLRSFAAGRVSDAQARAKGYDPRAVRKFHSKALKRAA